VHFLYDSNLNVGPRADAMEDNGQTVVEQPKLSPAVDFLAGTFAGIASLLVGYPLDTGAQISRNLSAASEVWPSQSSHAERRDVQTICWR